MAAEASTDAAMSDAAKQRGFRFALAVVFLDMLAIGIAVPVLPLLIGYFVNGADEQAHWYGIMAAVFGIMQFLCMPLLGALSDRVGRRPVLILSSAGMSLNFLLTAWAPTLLWLFAGRVIGGACSASMSTASAYASDVSSTENRSKTFGMIGAAFGLGFICGPMIGGLLGSINYHLPFYVGAALCAGNALFGYLFVPESLPRERRNTFSFARANPFASMARLFKRGDIAGLIIVFALTSFAGYLLHSVWVLYAHFKFGWGPKENGIALFCVGLVTAVVQAALLSRLIKVFGEVRLVMIGLISGTIVYVGYGLSTEGWMFYVLILSNIFAFAAGPAMQGIISKATDPKEQGSLMGSLQSLGSLGIIIAPIVGTQTLAVVTHFPTNDWRIGAPFYLAAFLSALSCVIAWRFFARHGTPIHPSNRTPSSTPLPASD